MHHHLTYAVHILYTHIQQNINWPIIVHVRRLDVYSSGMERGRERERVTVCVCISLRVCIHWAQLYLYNGGWLGNRSQCLCSSGVNLPQLLSILSVRLGSKKYVRAKAFQRMELVFVTLVDSIVCLLKARSEGYVVLVGTRARRAGWGRRRGERGSGLWMSEGRWRPAWSAAVSVAVGLGCRWPGRARRRGGGCSGWRERCRCTLI